MSKHAEFLEYLNEHGRSPYKSICDSIFKGDERSFNESLSYLKANDLIRVRETDQRTLHTCYANLTDKGAAYAVQQQVDRANKWKSIMWHTINSLITATVTATVTILITRALS